MTRGPTCQPPVPPITSLPTAPTRASRWARTPATATAAPAGLPGPLGGIRVLDLGTVYAAPITAMILGDFGADVLKIEHPRGDPARSHGYSKDGHGLWWKVIARNKHAVTLNLSHPAGRELLEGLAADADVLIENFRPGVMEKWGLGPSRLHEINPALVILRVTGFGQFGPYAKRRAFGTLAEAMTGFAHQTGQPDGPPTLPPFGLADGVTGLAGTIAVLLALYRRTANGGHGQAIDVSLLEPLLTILGPGPSAYDQLEIVPGRHGNRSLNNAPATPTRPATAAGSPSRPAPPRSPSASCAWSGAPTSPNSPGSAPRASGYATATSSTTSSPTGSGCATLMRS